MSGSRDTELNLAKQKIVYLEKTLNETLDRCAVLERNAIVDRQTIMQLQIALGHQQNLQTNPKKRKFVEEKPLAPLQINTQNNNNATEKFLEFSGKFNDDFAQMDPNITRLIFNSISTSYIVKRLPEIAAQFKNLQTLAFLNYSTTERLFISEIRFDMLPRVKTLEFSNFHYSILNYFFKDQLASYINITKLVLTNERTGTKRSCSDEALLHLNDFILGCNQDRINRGLNHRLEVRATKLNNSSLENLWSKHPQGILNAKKLESFASQNTQVFRNAQTNNNTNNNTIIVPAPQLQNEIIYTDLEMPHDDNLAGNESPILLPELDINNNTDNNYNRYQFFPLSPTAPDGFDFSNDIIGSPYVAQRNTGNI